MAFETILLEKSGHVAKLVLNRPEKRNALNRKMMEELVSAVEEVARDDDLRVLVLTGSGKAFCAGADIDLMGDLQFSGSLKAASVEELRRSFIFRNAKRLILGLQTMEKPTLAMINGACVGAGFDLALACDLRTGCEYSRFMCGFVKIGLFPGFGATWLYPRAMGLGKALEMLFTGDEMGAAEAERIGVLNKVYPAASLEEETMKLAQKIAAGPPVAIRLMKSSVYRGLQTGLEAVLDDAAVYESITLLSQDHQEGVVAMLEKRTPGFKGK